MGFTALEIPNEVLEEFKGKPRWVTCAAVAAVALTIVASAVTIGIVMGYTYCYLEYRSKLRSNEYIQIVRMTTPESPAATGNRSINGALMSSVIISRILTFGQSLMEDELSFLPWPNEKS